MIYNIGFALGAPMHFIASKQNLTANHEKHEKTFLLTDFYLFCLPEKTHISTAAPKNTYTAAPVGIQHSKLSQSGARAGTQCQAPPGQTPGGEQSIFRAALLPISCQGLRAGAGLRHCWDVLTTLQPVEHRNRGAGLPHSQSDFCGANPEEKPVRAQPGAPARMSNKDLLHRHCT